MDVPTLPSNPPTDGTSSFIAIERDLTLQAVGFHMFIGLFLGLMLFAFQAISFRLLRVDDERYRRLGLQAGGLWGRAKGS